MTKKTILLATALAAGLAAPAANSAQPFGVETGYTFQIRGFVPVICRATVDADHVVPQDGKVALGTMREFCNSASGYEVWADHSTGLAGSSLVVDGHEVRLSLSGATLISQSRSAAVAKRDLMLNLAEGATSGSLSIRVIAL